VEEPISATSSVEIQMVIVTGVVVANAVMKTTGGVEYPDVNLLRMSQGQQCVETFPILGRNRRTSELEILWVYFQLLVNHLKP